MDKIILNTQTREAAGKTASKKLRHTDTIPAVVYKRGQKTIPIQIKNTEFVHALHTSAGENAIITLKFMHTSRTEAKPAATPDTKTVIIKDIQYHPIKDNILHVDFQEISLTEKIKINVPIVLKGEATGVKADGGVLEHVTKEIEIECLPTQIPGKIELNVEALKIGDVIHVKDLKIPPDVKVLTLPEQAVALVSLPKVEEVAPAAEAAEEEAKEPEVIAEKKAEERAAEAAKEKAEKAEKEKAEEKKPEQKGK